jgi:hypothetical protein
MSEANKREKEVSAEVRVVVEVDGTPVGFLNLDVERLWPLINHRERDTVNISWIDPERYEAVMRAAVVKQLTSRLAGQLYHVLGAEIVKSELDVENIALKAEAAAQLFGRTREELDKSIAESKRSSNDFYTFFWDYMLEDRDGVDLKKEWKAKIV